MCPEWPSRMGFSLSKKCDCTQNKLTSNCRHQISRGVVQVSWQYKLYPITSEHLAPMWKKCSCWLSLCSGLRIMEKDIFSFSCLSIELYIRDHFKPFQSLNHSSPVASSNTLIPWRASIFLVQCSSESQIQLKDTSPFSPGHKTIAVTGLRDNWLT